MQSLAQRLSSDIGEKYFRNFSHGSVAIKLPNSSPRAETSPLRAVTSWLAAGAAKARLASRSTVVETMVENLTSILKS